MNAKPVNDAAAPAPPAAPAPEQKGAQVANSELDQLRVVGRPLDGHLPDVHPRDAWTDRKLHYNLVNPNNRRKFKVIVVGTGLSGAGCAAALGELGYDVEVFSFHDLPRRAHSIAAQGGINSPRARKVDNDSIDRFVKDTVKGGDYRGREEDAYRLGEEGIRVINHMQAIGAAFAREYGGQLATRSFGGVQVSRTYYTRGQTGQQLELAAAHALSRQVAAGTCKLHSRQEMLDVIMKDGRAQGIVVRDLVTGTIRPQTAHAVILCTGGYGNIYYKATLAKNSNATAIWRAYKRGAFFANPCFVQIHPTALPLMSKWQSKKTLMSESLRNDGRIWAPRKKKDDRDPNTIPEDERFYFLEERYPAFGNLVPRDVASRNIRERIDAGYGVGPLHNAVYLDFRTGIERLGVKLIRERYSNLFNMYEELTGEDPYKTPMRIAPSVHFTMGGLWTDYDQMTAIPGLFVGGEAGWAYHGANRLGANSLLSGCVDGWFTLPYSVPNYLAGLLGTEPLAATDKAVQDTVKAVQEGEDRLLNNGGTHGPDHFHEKLGAILDRYASVSRDPEGLATAIGEIRELREEFWRDVKVVGDGDRLNQELETAGRVADYLELAELLCIDALDRDESAGAHFRTDHEIDGEAKRDDEDWCFCSAWEFPGAVADRPIRNFEPLTFRAVPLQQRNYK
ncbi:MAG: fumarate reductase/succinate dehydrogenase flavoprotein subunit [Bifidobacteriaceae bacterium]|jgi:succinate dehydrogenase / fumarate reductase flavoprotein subunit|nr:fumarate reductase/succinate dehydrogenase flavoprotein subunit [Bifidobacteriaceae bacterium]